MGLFGGSNAGTGAEWNPYGDDDGDGIENQFEEIVVTATAEQRAQAIAAYNSARQQATNDVNMGLDFMTAVVTYLGARGRERGSAAAAALLQELNNHRDALITERTNWYFQQDAEDGNLDGNHDTNITPMPPIPW
jgi:hypothetical protein